MKSSAFVAVTAGAASLFLACSASGAIVSYTATLSGAWNILKLVPVAQSLFSLFKKKKD